MPPRITSLALLTLLAACSEYDLGVPIDPEFGPTDDGSELTTGEAATDTGAEDTSTDPFDDPGVDEVPDEFIADDCADGVVVDWLDAEVAVLAGDSQPGRLAIDVPAAGTYHIYDLAIAESGASQWNESAYLRIRNAANPEGRPLITNCGEEWVVVDPDNHGPLPQGTSQYMGTFVLDEGIQVVKLRHYCWLYRAGECTDMHFTDHASSTCETSNPNSVHMGGGSLCLRPAG